MKAISDVKEQDLDRFNRSYIRYQTLSGGRMLNGKTEIELGINAESIRLIANAVIF